MKFVSQRSVNFPLVAARASDVKNRASPFGRWKLGAVFSHTLGAKKTPNGKRPMVISEK